MTLCAPDVLCDIQPIRVGFVNDDHYVSVVKTASEKVSDTKLSMTFSTADIGNFINPNLSKIDDQNSVENSQ